MMRFDAARQRAMQAQSLSREQVLADDPAGVLDGALPAIGKGIAAGATQISGLLYGAAGGAVQGYNHVLQWQDELAALIGLPDSFMAGQISTDWLDRQRDTALNAAQRYKPDPATTGLAGQVLFDLGRIMTQVAGGAGAVVATGGAGAAALAGGAAVTGAATTYGKFDELKRAGIDDDTALKVAAIEGLTTGAGVMVPAALGWQTMTRAGVSGAKGYLGANVLYGAGANIGMGVAQRGASYTLLQQNGYAQMAAHYEPLEASALLAEGALGAIFGAVGARAGLPNRAGAVRDAALASTAARHAALDTAPGIPADPATAAAHSRALNEAIEQLLGDAPVNVADSGITDGQFVPRPREAAGMDAVRAYYQGVDDAHAPPVAMLIGEEIAPHSADLKTLRASARQWYETNLRGKTVLNRASGRKIEFRNARKAFSTSANPDKLRLFAALEQIVAEGEIKNSTPPSEPRHAGGIKAYHWLESVVALGQQRVRVGVTLREDGKGNLYYNHNPVQEKGHPNQTKTTRPHNDGAQTDKDAPTQTIPDNADNVNIEIVKAREIYEPAWEATKARNADSSLGAPLRENDVSGNLRPPGTSQATVSQSGVWDTGISSTSANRVPSGNDSGNSITGITEPPDASLPLTAARAGDDIETRAGLALLEQRPDMTEPVTLEDGQTVHVPLQEALRQADAEGATARPDALAAAVQCRLTRGA